MDTQDILSGLSPLGAPILDTFVLGEPLRMASYFRAAAGLDLNAGPVADAVRADMPIQTIGSTAIISVVGITNKRLRARGILASYISTIAAVKAAVADKQISDIMLKIDSPGGYTAGVAEAADAIYDAAQRKPTVAVIDGIGASAAYWLASQANAIYAGRNDEVGSIGVLAVIYDVSAMAEKDGIKAEVFATGKYKWAGVPGTALTDEQKEYIQGLVDAVGDAFVRDVARGRRMAVEDVARLADGRVWPAKEALERGLIDGIKSFVDAYDDLAARRATSRRLAEARLEAAKISAPG